MLIKQYIIEEWIEYKFERATEGLRCEEHQRLFQKKWVEGGALD